MKKLKGKAKKVILLTMLAVVMLTLSISPAIAETVNGYITAEAAQQIALDRVPGATVSVVELDKGKSGAKYEVKLYDETYRYEVDVDAVTGAVTGFEQKSSKSNSNSKSVIEDSAYIGIDAAKVIALENSGLSAGSVVFTKAKIDREKSKVVYEIEFVAEGIKYKYEISAVSGEFIKQSRKNVKTDTGIVSGNNTKNLIGIDAAKAVALEHAGFSESDVVFTKLKTERDDGVIVYDIEFITNDKEYEYEINAVTGTVIEFEVDNR